MNRKIFLACSILLLSANCCFASEIIKAFEDEDLVILNEELRQRKEATRDNDDDISDLQDSEYKVKASSSDEDGDYLDAKVKNSIEVDSDDLQLVNDAASPGATKYYGTNGGGTKGFHTLSLGPWATSDLKTSTGSVSTISSTLVNLTLPGGSYGFYPQVKTTVARQLVAQIASGFTTNSYVTNIALSVVGGGPAYAQQRYVTSSGPDHWIFFLVDKETKSIVSGWESPDHPCYGTGITEKDMPHPFGDYDSEKFFVVLADNEVIEKAKERVTRGKTLLEVLLDNYQIDFASYPEYEPREIIEVDEWGTIEGETIKTINTPQWARIKINSDTVELKKRVVEKLPKGIKYKRMKRRES